MTTRNFVPRIDGEGQVGTETKKWSKIYSNSIYVNNIIGDLTGTADKAIKDNKNQQIDSTYIKNISINNDTLTVTKGNGGSQNIVVNNISHAISSDNAINANKLQELTAGNSNGQIPINNGVENKNLNAALLNGKASSYFATSNHTHTTATQSSNGYMSNVDKKKLDGIASGAEVNQNAFANVKVGTTTIQADAKQDTLELVAGTNISLVGDANNDKVTIGVTGKVASASQADNATKATQDSAGQEIVSTYIKNLFHPMVTQQIRKNYICCTLGDGSTLDSLESGNFIEIDNVTHAYYATYSTTQATTDNSTKVATTEFVRNLINQFKNDGTLGGIVGGSLTQNGWVKFSNGLILQWGNIGLTGNSWEGEIGPYNFPVAFNNQCFLVLPSLCNNDNTNPISYDSTVQQRKWNTKQFWLYQQSMGGKPWFGHAHYISIGN